MSANTWDGELLSKSTLCGCYIRTHSDQVILLAVCGLVPAVYTLAPLRKVKKSETPFFSSVFIPHLNANKHSIRPDQFDQLDDFKSSPYLFI